ncbi:HNH endonuclease [Photobacterium arenosum]
MDVTLDHRLLTEEGWNNIAEDVETVNEAIGSVATTIGMRQVAQFLYDIDDQQVSALMQDNAEKTLDALIAQGVDPKVAKALLTNPEFYNTVGSILTNGELVETGEGLGGNSGLHSQTDEDLELLVTLERTSFQKVLLGFDEAQDFVADLPAEQAEAAMLAMSLLTGGVVKTVIDIAKDAVVDTAIGDEIREFQHDVAKEIASSANHLDTKSHEFLLDYEKGEGFSTSLQEGAEFGLAVVGIGVGLGVAGKTGLGDNDKPDLVHSGKQEVDGQGGTGAHTDGKMPDVVGSASGFYDPFVWRQNYVDFYSGNVTSTTVPPYSAKNVQMVGQRHPVTGVVFDQRGYPIFDNDTVYDTRFKASDFGSASYQAQMRMATRDLREIIEVNLQLRSQFNASQLQAIQSGNAKIPGYTWHHHQDTGRMQFVDESVHRSTGHIGGEAMIGGQ